MHPHGRRRHLLERRRDDPVHVARNLHLRQSDERSSSIPPHSSANSASGRMNVRPFTKMTEDLRDVQQELVRYRPHSGATGSRHLVQYYRDNPGLISRVSDRVQRFDPGIAHRQIQQAQEFKHNGLDTPIHLSNESAGTHRLVTGTPFLNVVLETGGIAVMDSIDSDFHTDLVAGILDWFWWKDLNHDNAQLMCSLQNVTRHTELKKERMFVSKKIIGWRDRRIWIS